jgi:hypothetical protein
MCPVITILCCVDVAKCKYQNYFSDFWDYWTQGFPDSNFVCGIYIYTFFILFMHCLMKSPSYVGILYIRLAYNDHL